MTTTYFTHDSFDAISGFSLNCGIAQPVMKVLVVKVVKDININNAKKVYSKIPKNAAICVSCTSGRSNRAAVRFSTSGRFGL